MSSLRVISVEPAWAYYQAVSKSGEEYLAKTLASIKVLFAQGHEVKYVPGKPGRPDGTGKRPPSYTVTLTQWVATKAWQDDVYQDVLVRKVEQVCKSLRESKFKADFGAEFVEAVQDAVELGMFLAEQQR